MAEHYRLQTTIDFLIHLSYKTGQFEALYKILESSTTTSNHFIGTFFIIFHYGKNMNIGSSPKFSELIRQFVKDTLLSANWHIKSCFILSSIDYVISHEGGN